MEGLKRLIDADGWLWSTRCYDLGEDCPIDRPVHRNVLHDGLNKVQLGGWIDGYQAANDELPEEGPPEEGPLATLAMLDEHFTRTRRDLVPDDAWYGHPFVQECRLDKGIDHFVCSFYPLMPRHYSVITLFRRTGREPFGRAERRLCHLVVEATESFHHSVFDNHEPRDSAGLTPRQRSVLVRLLHGKSRDEIAEELRIAPATAKSHIRSVYRYFDVDSQVKLMFMFYGRDGSTGKKHSARDSKGRKRGETRP